MDIGDPIKRHTVIPLKHPVQAPEPTTPAPQRTSPAPTPAPAKPPVPEKV